MNDTLQKALLRVDKLQHQVDSLKNSQEFDHIKYRALTLQLDSIKTHMPKDSAVINSRIEQANETISNLSSLSTGFGTMYSIIGIIVGAILVAYTALSIYNQIQLNNLKKRVKNLIDEKFDKMFQSKFREQFDISLDQMESNDETERNKGISYLRLQLFDKLNNIDFLRLKSIVEGEILIPYQKTTLTSYLSSLPKNKYLDQYFDHLLLNNSLKGTGDHLYQFALNYIIKNNSDQISLFKNLKKIMINSNIEDHIIQIPSYLIAKDRYKAAELLLNDDEILVKLKNISDLDKSTIESALKQQISTLEKLNDYDKTLVWKEFIK